LGFGKTPWNKGKTGIYSFITIEKNRVSHLRENLSTATLEKMRKPKTEDQKEKLRKPKSPEYLEKQHLNPNSGMKGKHHSKETKEKEREAHAGEKNIMYGKHHSLETKEKMRTIKNKAWGDPEYRDKCVSAILKASRKRPTFPESQLSSSLNLLFPGEYKYVGNGEIIIAGKNPDFININGKKKIIEMYGDYWHRNDDPQERIDLFKQYGYDTLIVWQRELKDIPKLQEKLESFCNKDQRPPSLAD
jgi:G:T-mismatch repair DNA endonuclease (very short patch repair protein)